MLEADDIFDHEVLRTKCLHHSGFLPEPMDEKDHRFLLNLNTSTFALGIRKKRGRRWVYETDDTAVKWFNWARTQAPGARSRHCAIVDTTGVNGEPGKWVKFRCEGVDYITVRQMAKSLICQSDPGMSI